MFSDIRKRSHKAGQPPGTPIYTGDAKTVMPRVTVVAYTPEDYYEKSGATLAECLPVDFKAKPTVTWVNVEGLNDVKLVEQITKQYNLHPLTIEDIVNVGQRSKIDEFDNYLFVTLKTLQWDVTKKNFSMGEVSLAIGVDFLLSFQDRVSPAFDSIRERIHTIPQQGLRKQGPDYLAYRLMDIIIDQYFLVLEGLGDQIEKLEDSIITNPTREKARALYRLKNQMLVLRKAIWPIREVVNQLVKVPDGIIMPGTQVYFRDLYDHTVQAIEGIETFREILSNMLDIYLSSLTNRMNEIMKVLTVIATIFIPVTFIASVFGMNFKYMPGLEWPWGYPVVLILMFCVIGGMIYYFKRKKWW